MSSSTAPVGFSFDACIARITLQREEKLNAFDHNLVEGLHHALDQAETQKARLIVFEAAGKGFSGGLDLSNLDTQSDGDLLLRVVRIEQFLQRVHHNQAATLALVHGSCFGAAADLVLACDARVAAPNARFRMPGAHFGLILGTRRLSDKVGEKNARCLLLSDTPFDAETARKTGFVTAIESPEHWPDHVNNLAKRICQLSPGTYSRLSARLIHDSRSEDMAALIESVTDGSIKSRMIDYQARMLAAGAAKDGT